MKSLIAAGARLVLKDSFKYTALTHAKERGHAEIVEVLLKAGAQDPLQKTLI